MVGSGESMSMGHGTPRLKTFTSLDGQEVYPGVLIEPDRYRQIEALPIGAALAVQGSSLSFAAASFGNHANVVSTKHFNRILAFEPENGIVEVEAGVQMAILHDFLLARGFGVAIQPGHPQVTLGGCIAANVHGKNQFAEGNFRGIVESLQLFHPAHGTLLLSESENRDIFELTCGGLGLTGLILSARIRVRPIEGNCYRVTHVAVRDLAEAGNLLFKLSGEHHLLYSWHDLARFDRTMGRGYIVAGDLIKMERPPAPPSSPLNFISRPLRSTDVPLLNAMTIPLINEIYYWVTRNRQGVECDLYSTHFPWHDKNFYFRAFGKAGFHEVQMLIPTDNFASFVSEFEALVRRYRIPLAFASMKVFKGVGKLLRYDGTGISMGLHVRAGRIAREMLGHLDQIVIRHGAINNIYKDSRLTAETIRREYAEYDVFRDGMRAFDPRRTFVTRLAERLGL